MKKTILIALLFSGAALSAHSIHYWTKASETDGVRGQKVCEWTCSIYNQHHSVTTSGYGYCPRPS